MDNFLKYKYYVCSKPILLREFNSNKNATGNEIDIKKDDIIEIIEVNCEQRDDDYLYVEVLFIKYRDCNNSKIKYINLDKSLFYDTFEVSKKSIRSDKIKSLSSS